MISTNLTLLNKWHLWLKYICLGGVLLTNLNANSHGFSVGIGTGIPMGGLNSWYSPVPKLAISYFYSPQEETKIFYEIQYQNYTHGAIEGKEFQWQIDYQKYPSPEARANMAMNSFVIKIQQSLDWKIIQSNTFSPYFTYGFGFYNYTHKVSGLIYPGQSTKPLDTSFILDPITDRRVAWGATFGLGAEKSINESLMLNLNLDYHGAIGYLRSFEDWGLYEVFPIQYLSIEMGIGYTLNPNN